MLWKKGGLSATELKQIIIGRMPQEWNDKLKMIDIKNELRGPGTTQTLVRWLTSVEANERREARNEYSNDIARTRPERTITGRRIPEETVAAEARRHHHHQGPTTDASHYDQSRGSRS